MKNLWVGFTLWITGVALGMGAGNSTLLAGVGFAAMGVGGFIIVFGSPGKWNH